MRDISDLKLDLPDGLFNLNITNKISWIIIDNLKRSNNECNPLPYFYNNSIGNAIGPYSMIAPFFDDLDDNGYITPEDVSVLLYSIMNGGDFMDNGDMNYDTNKYK